MGRRRPAKTGHVWTPTDTVGPMVIVRRRFKRLRRTVASGMRCDRGLGEWRAEIGQRRRCSGGRRAGTGLREVSPYMGRDRAIVHVVIARSVEIQRGKFTGRRNRRVLGGRRRRMGGNVVWEESLARAPRSLFVLPQVGFRLSRRLLDRSRVVVLMSRQGSPAGKRLLAVRVRTFVGSLAGMDSAVSS